MTASEILLSHSELASGTAGAHLLSITDSDPVSETRFVPISATVHIEQERTPRVIIDSSNSIMVSITNVGQYI